MLNYSVHATNSTKRTVGDEFGPFLQAPGRDSFDFTLLFEDSILSILPSSLLLLVLPFRIAKLWHEPRKVVRSPIRTVKIIMLSVFSVLQFVNLLVWALNPNFRTRASIAAASLSLLGAVGLSILSYLEHTRCIRPSPIINAYLLLTVPFDAAKTRTLWLRGDSPLVASVASSVLIVKLIVLVVEASEKRRILLSPYSEYSPEATSGLYAQGLFWWLNPIFLLGFKNILREMDLFPTDNGMKSELLRERFQRQWAKRQNPARRYELILTMARCMLGPLLTGVIPRFLQTFFTFMQPLLIQRVTRFVAQPETLFSTNQGWGLTAAYGLVYTGGAIAAATYTHRGYRVTTMARGALITSIYTKTLDLSITSLDEAAAITLMSTDVGRICDNLWLLHELWACPLDLGLAVWLLYNEIGLAMLGPLILSLTAVSILLLISKWIATAQKTWVAKIQVRVDLTAKVLQSMKAVKMLGLTATLGDIIEQLRIAEIASSLKLRQLLTCSISCGNSIEIFAPGIAFTIFVISTGQHGQPLTISRAFSTLSLIALISRPVKWLICLVIPALMGAVGCFDRIQDYLLLESRLDHRLLARTSQQQEISTSLQDAPDQIERDRNGIELAEFVHPKCSVNSSITRSTLQAVNCTLTWRDAEHPLINDISFEISPGLTMLIGPVGCGKSSLIKALLGEISFGQGYVYTDSLQVALVDQTPWIQHGTLRENILGVSSFDDQFYSRVVHACALDDDFEMLEHGDHTQVGSGGTGLSGGQKLRVALARAVYSRRSILILDDVFSGLDAGSEDHIFSRLLGRHGLLRESKDMTVLLATHAVHRLSYADMILVLDSQGTLCEQGSFPELIRTNGYVANLTARHTTESQEEPKDTVKPTKATPNGDVAQANAADDLSRPVGDIALYKYYFASCGYCNILLFFVLFLTEVFFIQFPVLWVKFWTSAVATKGNSVNGFYIGWLIAFEVIALTALAAAVYHAQGRMVPRSALGLHRRLLSTVKNSPLSYFTSTNVGQIVNRFSQDMDVCDFELPWALVELTASSTFAILQAIFICLSAAYFATIMPVVIGIMYMVQKFYLRTSRQIRLMDLEAKSPLYSHFLETLNGLVTIRAFGWVPDFEQRNLDLLDQSQRPYYMLFCIQRWLNLVLDLTVAGLAVVLMVFIVSLRHSLDAGFVGVALLSVMNFNLSLTEVVKQWTALETSLGAISRVKTFVQVTPSEHTPQENQTIAENWPLRYSIGFHNVSTSYTAGGPLVLKDININIPAGQKLGVAGRSGSGKSSLVASLFRMLEIGDGTITIDDIDISTIPREEVRRSLNIIPQDPFFFGGTIRKNIDPFSLAQSDDSLIAALRKVGLWDIVLNAGGLDVSLSDPESIFSHGQRQLFCLARAVIFKQKRSRPHSRLQNTSNILILDEATASVDIETDERMQHIIRDEFKDCTIIAVAHRLGTIKDFDRIIVLDQGRIVEDGSPNALLEDSGSRFRRLWDS